MLEQINSETLAHPNIGLIIIDTLQKIRGRTNKNEGIYSSDYREMAILKEFADKNKLAILLVHHLRKMRDEDIFNCISGSNGLMGACDTVYILNRKKREDNDATLIMTGRDIRHNEIPITFNVDKYIWESAVTKVAVVEETAQAYDNNPIEKSIKRLLEQNTGIWIGTTSDLIEASKSIGISINMSPVSLGLAINTLLSKLKNDGIEHSVLRGRRHRFAYKQQKFDDS